MPTPKHVAVLMGGWSSEREVSLNSGRACAKALEEQGYRVTPIDVRPDIVQVLPGVGAFGDCMRKLRERGMDEACLEAYLAGKPFLGVCVALQVFFEASEESPGVEGLGILPGRVVRFDAGDLKVPHMGWNDLDVVRPHPVLEELGGEAFYFVHSYYPEPAQPADLLAVSDYGGAFCAAAGRENLAAVQFHPEKSSRAGLRLYENFLGWARSI